jgi:hypothetical protein
MSYWDDDVVVIDSSSRSDADPLNDAVQFNSDSDPSRDVSTDPDEGTNQSPRGVAASPASQSTAHPAKAFDSTSHRLREKLQTFSSTRMEVNTQTDTSSPTSDADAVHRHLAELDAALGIQVTVPPSEASEARKDICNFIAAWRAKTRSWKRPRQEFVTTTQVGDTGVESTTVTTAAKVVKCEGTSPRCTADASSFLSSTPAWALGLSAALEQCQRLLSSTEATQRVCAGGDDALRRVSLTALPVASSPTSSPSAPSFSPRGGSSQPSVKAERAPLPPPPSRRGNEGVNVITGDQGEAASSLLREAEVICAREKKSTLLPFYTELQALRKQNLTLQKAQAHAVSHDLEWEQRLLTDVLTECETQLDFMTTNFLESCRGKLAPLDALQRRMEVLQGYQEKLHAAQAAAASFAAVSAAPLTHCHDTQSRVSVMAAGVEFQTLRTLGRAADVLARHSEDERGRLAADLDAARALLAEQERQNANLRARYASVTTQLQNALDAENFVDKEAINALKQQQRETLAGVVERFGWTLVNATPDVLSLRHPRTGEVLHANHTYPSVNGKPCEDVAKALAEYVVRHATAGPAPVAHTAKTAADEDGEAGTAAVASPSASQQASLALVGDPNELAGGREGAARASVTSSAENNDDTESHHGSRVASVKSVEAGVSGPCGDTSTDTRQPSAGKHSDNDDASSHSTSPSTAATTHSTNAEENDEAEDEDGFSSLENAGEAAGEEDEESSPRNSRKELADGKHEDAPRGGKEEEGEDFVNYSNLQSDTTANSHQTDTSAAVNTSAVSAATRQPPASASESPGVDGETAATHVYTGFFTENALWEDDSDTV